MALFSEPDLIVRENRTADTTRFGTGRVSASAGA